MGAIPSIVGFIGCGLLGLGCMHAPSQSFSSLIETYASSSPDVTVVTSVNGSTTTQTIPAPYGIETSMVTESDGTSTKTESTTTPITAADAAQMQQQEEQQAEAMQQQMNQLFADQQKLFEDMWNNFPSM